MQDALQGRMARGLPDDGRPVVAFAPGAVGPSKRWTVAYYAELARTLTEPTASRSCGCWAARRRARLPPRSCAAAGEHAHDLTSPDLRNAILALKLARAAVSNDSGLVHVAAAIGTPSVGIFGPTSPWHWAPLNKLAATIETTTNVPCRPCHKPTCRTCCIIRCTAVDIPSRAGAAGRGARRGPDGGPGLNLLPEAMADPRQDVVVAHLRRSRDAVERVASDATFIAAIVAIAERIANSLKAGGKVLLAGNGGSAADAQHIAAEFVGRFVNDRAPLAAIALTTDTSALTAIANDFMGSSTCSNVQVRALGARATCSWASPPRAARPISSRRWLGARATSSPSVSPRTRRRRCTRYAIMLSPFRPTKPL